jgi:hypothetical protein
VKARLEKWGHAGTSKTFLRAYNAILEERGFSDDNPPPQGEVPMLWNQAKERLEILRREHLAAVRKNAVAALKKKNPEWGTGAWRKRKKSYTKRCKEWAEKKKDGEPWASAPEDAHLSAIHQQAIAASRKEPDLAPPNGGVVRSKTIPGLSWDSTALRAFEEQEQAEQDRLAREEQAVLDSFGVKKPGELSDGGLDFGPERA